MTPLTLPVAAPTAAETRRACGDEPGLACRNVLDWTGDRDLAELAQWAFDVPLAIALIAVVALIVVRIARRLITRGLLGWRDGPTRRLGVLRGRTPSGPEGTARTEQRLLALVAVLSGAASIAIWTIAGFLMLDEVGVNLAPLLAGAGVVGVALGFGAQSLVKDVLAGIGFLLDDEFGVGDIVDLDPDVQGTVEELTLTTTRVRAVDGTVWYMPNGEVRRVGNRSQHWSRALLDIEVAYETDLAHARAVIQRVADEVAATDDAVIGEPEVWGVESFGASAIVIRLVVKTKPSEQWRVSRGLRERLKVAFDREGIEIPFPQQTVRVRGEQGVSPEQTDS